ncbi:MAG: hypothetical protein OYH77_03140 [Pseudomonadota bacterium]|nr:hypothetical protein [Pseudomonadota bacterium]
MEISSLWQDIKYEESIVLRALKISLLGLACLLLTAISCKQARPPDSNLVCPEGQSVIDGSCAAVRVTHDSCEGTIDIKRAPSGCIFHTASQVHGCVVSGFAPYHNPVNDKCLVKTSYGRHCEFGDFDQATKTCNSNIEPEDAGVSVYLDRRDSGFYPQVIFRKSDNVQAGADFEFLAHEYSEADIKVDPELAKGRRLLSVELVIPWRVVYTDGSGNELCAEGEITKNTSAEYPSEGKFCAGS